jgi:Acyclic terpene utilisation family protein AtuA
LGTQYAPGRGRPGNDQLACDILSAVTSPAETEATTLLAATGMLGSGYLEASIAAGIERGAELIGCDAGTTDFGPHLLATGRAHFSRAAVRRDTEVMLRQALAAHIPLVIGSAGGSGGDLGLAWMREIVADIAAEHGLHLRLAQVHAEQPRERVAALLADRRITALAPAHALTEETVHRSEHIVAMMGPEPIQSALTEGADLVLAGRASDAAIFAALPLTRGLPPAICWHAGKILECGAAAVAQRAAPDSMLATLRADSFDVAPLRPDYRCTPQSVASHTLYENADPFHLVEPPGVLDTREAEYAAIDDRTVRVTGSSFSPAPYSLKLEAAALAGYSTIVLGAVRDPLILRQLDSWMARLDDALSRRLRDLGLADGHRVITRVYGRDGVMGALEPLPRLEGQEAVILWEVISGSQERSHAVAASLSHMAVHNPIPEWHGLITGLAYPFAPAEIDRGPVYEFTMNHVVTPVDPLELFSLEVEDL